MVRMLVRRYHNSTPEVRNRSFSHGLACFGEGAYGVICEFVDDGMFEFSGEAEEIRHGSNVPMVVMG